MAGEAAGEVAGEPEAVGEAARVVGEAATAGAAGNARVVVVTRVDCHLCDDAVAVVEAVCAETGDTWTTRDVDADPALRRYSDEVPVTFVDGLQHDFWRVDPMRLRRALGGGPARPRG